MAGPWKAWKTKGGFSTLPPAPWESRKKREIPTFPQPRRRIPIHPAKAEPPEELATLEKWKSKSGIPTFPPSQNRLRRKVKSLKTNTKGESRRFTKPRTFRIILYWNQKSFSGSFFDWKMLVKSETPMNLRKCLPRLIFQGWCHLSGPVSARAAGQPAAAATTAARKASIAARQLT
jgi:hypothetical protein